MDRVPGALHIFTPEHTWPLTVANQYGCLSDCLFQKSLLAKCTSDVGGAENKIVNHEGFVGAAQMQKADAGLS